MRACAPVSLRFPNSHRVIADSNERRPGKGEKLFSRTCMGTSKESAYLVYLSEIVARHTSPSSQSWWESAFTTIVCGTNFGKVYARTARILGAVPIALNQDEILSLSKAGYPSFQGRALHELGRTVLILRAIQNISHEAGAEFIDDLYVHGDVAERQALLRALPLMPEPERFLTTAVEACRSNVQTVFEAIACENSYPVRHFPELNFNQMVMRAIFIGIPLLRIEGLSSRITPDLLRMAKDYAQERCAAGHSVPHDIQLLTSGR